MYDEESDKMKEKWVKKSQERKSINLESSLLLNWKALVDDTQKSRYMNCTASWKEKEDWNKKNSVNRMSRSGVKFLGYEDGGSNIKSSHEKKIPTKASLWYLSNEEFFHLSGFFFSCDY